MAIQLALAFLGPPGWAAAIAVTAMVAVAGVMMADETDEDDSPFKYPTGGFGNGSTTVTVPSYSGNDVEEYYRGGELPLVIDGEGTALPSVSNDDYTAGSLAPVYEPQNPWGYVKVHLPAPETPEPEDEDGYYNAPTSRFDIYAHGYDSGIKYLMIIVGCFLCMVWLIALYGQHRRELW